MGGTTAIRDELLRLHAMVLTIVEGIALTVPAESACIWAEAESLQTDLEALAFARFGIHQNEAAEHRTMEA
jgi:hypothetical protein|tara:strand:- start:7217 stop:7429 length:213 start_codon:yes stop_codon:yes gene_type:complete